MLRRKYSIFPNLDFYIKLLIISFQNLHLYEEQEELESIIKQAAKERLQLEKQLVKAKMAAQTQVSFGLIFNDSSSPELFLFFSCIKSLCLHFILTHFTSVQISLICLLIFILNFINC